MKVKALCDFYDLEAKANRTKGKDFSCSDERGNHLASIGYVEVCAEKAPERHETASKAIPSEDEDKD